LYKAALFVCSESDTFLKNCTISSSHYTQNLFINIPKFPDHLQPVLPHYLGTLNQRSHHPLIIPLQMQILPNPKSLPVLPLPGFLHNLPRFRIRHCRRQLLPPNIQAPSFSPQTAPLTTSSPYNPHTQKPSPRPACASPPSSSLRPLRLLHDLPPFQRPLRLRKKFRLLPHQTHQRILRKRLLHPHLAAGAVPMHPPRRTVQDTLLLRP